MRRVASVALSTVLASGLGACTVPLHASLTEEATVRTTLPGTVPASARIAIVGDVMLGRGVATVVRSDPTSIFEGVRPVLVDADLAIGNLESPLTDRPHRVGRNALEADPRVAPALLAGAGIDVVSIANNHAGDAGPRTVPDTLAALATAGIEVVGGGEDRDAAMRAVQVDLGGLDVALLAFDLTGGGPPAGDGPGVARWNVDLVRGAVVRARAVSDVVVVGLHGGVEYLPRPDPGLRTAVDLVSAWGADVVWASGAHVDYPVTSTRSSSGRTIVQAPGLGNALFDQSGRTGTDEGVLLEVLVDGRGVVAHRTGRLASYLRSRFVGWDQPEGDAVSLGGEWWSLDQAVPVRAGTAGPSAVGWLPATARVVGQAAGDIDGDGTDDVVVSYRLPYRTRVLHAAFPGVRFADRDGRTAHLAVFRAGDGTRLWGAGTMLDPVETFAVCDGSLALGFAALDEPGVRRAGAWTWRHFGFSTAPPLDGPAAPGCADIDRDGRTEPVLLDRDPVPEPRRP